LTDGVAGMAIHIGARVAALADANEALGSSTVKGYLTNLGGAPLNLTVNMTFRLYDYESSSNGKRLDRGKPLGKHFARMHQIVMGLQIQTRIQLPFRKKRPAEPRYRP